MQFLSKKNPAIYLEETTQYVKDLQQVTFIRNKCTEPSEIAEYDNILHCMREVLLFMNTVGKRDMAKLRSSLNTPAPQTPAEPAQLA